ncbi:MAG: hypothetical protein E2O91_04760 [Alphaproteobacteria bacterium]|nr:MAG: hypothetical protein E2O91_04760 [Alphaproteobacteria bacterium]
MRYLEMIWKAVGLRLILLPAAASGLLFWVKESFGSLPEISLTWVIVTAPLFVWLFGRVLFQAVKAQDELDLNPKPDVSARFAFRHLMVDSKWALGKRAPVGKNQNDPDNFYPEIEGTLRDAARASRLKVWAREEPSLRSKGGFKNTLEEGPAREWKLRRFNLPTCMDVNTPTACLGKYGGKILEDAMVCKKQVLINWPKANFFEKWRDPHYKDRLKFFKDESHTE